ncbi:hypothetical protein Bbelb_402650 [Branchiostoma belcheri]|nr:hypothetical protein Bbelb_402650 [Branchiostoma belcheri]
MLLVWRWQDVTDLHHQQGESQSLGCQQGIENVGNSRCDGTGKGLGHLRAMVTSAHSASTRSCGNQEKYKQLSGAANRRYSMGGTGTCGVSDRNRVTAARRNTSVLYLGLASTSCTHGLRAGNNVFHHGTGGLSLWPGTASLRVENYRLPGSLHGAEMPVVLLPLSAPGLHKPTSRLNFLPLIHVNLRNAEIIGTTCLQSVIPGHSVQWSGANCSANSARKSRQLLFRLPQNKPVVSAGISTVNRTNEWVLATLGLHAWLMDYSITCPYRVTEARKAISHEDTGLSM